jgi:8-oxo-dGTP pyrophosphatase MutT (NUDIX family)
MPLATMPNASIPAGLTSRTFDAIPADAKGHAAGVLFVAPDGDVLLCRRSGSEENYGGHWALPGGKAEDGESPARAAARESVEELGGSLDPKSLKLMDRKATPTGMVFHTFVRPVDKKFQPQINEEHSGFGWFPLDALPTPMHPGVASTLQDRLGLGEDMSHEDWDGLRSGFLKWIKEEEGEAEHAEDAVDIEIDDEHDGPWFSCMSKDGERMYRNRNVPASVEIKGKMADVNKLAKAHEIPEFGGMVVAIEAFKEEHGREPNDKERKAIYNECHRKFGIPGEQAEAKRQGIDWDAWNAWCRGIEAKLEARPFENEPDDADVKPIPHDHGDLEFTGDNANTNVLLELLGLPALGAGDQAKDSKIGRTRLALDKSSVRSFDGDGRLHISETNICMACISPYHGSEIPDWEELGLDPDKIYRLFRPPEELEKATPTINGIQLMRQHIPVDADDHQPWDVAGAVGTTARWEDPYIKNGLTIWVAEDIDGIKTKKKYELSPGYFYRAVMEPGIFKGEAYDGKMVDIVFNHLALVEEGRQGPSVSIGDSAEEVHWAIIENIILDLLTEPS